MHRDDTGNFLMSDKNILDMNTFSARPSSYAETYANKTCLKVQQFEAQQVPYQFGLI